MLAWNASNENDKFFLHSSNAASLKVTANGVEGRDCSQFCTLGKLIKLFVLSVNVLLSIHLTQYPRENLVSNNILDLILCGFR